MRYCVCLILALCTVDTATPASAAWPPSELEGAWNITWTSDDSRLKNIADNTRLLLLVRDRLILIERDVRRVQYADGRVLSNGAVKVEDAAQKEYRALVHTPTDIILPDGSKKPEMSKDPITFLLKTGPPATIDVTAEIAFKRYVFRGERIDKSSASEIIEELLADPEFKCARDIQILLETQVLPK